MVGSRSVGMRGIAVAAAGAWLVGVAVAGGGVAASPGGEPAAGVTRRMSVGPYGAQANGDSVGQAIAAIDRFVAFSSDASNLVAGDTNGTGDVFLRDRVRWLTDRVSIGSAGGTQANGRSFLPSISGDGLLVAFVSRASNLVAGDTNGRLDIFVRDRVGHFTKRVSVGPGGAQANRFSFSPAMAAEGQYVSFVSHASNLVAEDTNRTADIFVWDREAKVTRRVSVGPGGSQANSLSRSPAISADGRYVAFVSRASNLVAGDTNGTADIFVRDRVAHVTQRMSVGPGGTQANRGSNRKPAISADGRYVAFVSHASNLVTGDTNDTWDVFVRDRVAHVTRRVSVGPDGAQGDNASLQPAISADGRYVAFVSRASNLVPGDTNAAADVFVRDRVDHVTGRVSVGAGGAQADGHSLVPAISGDGLVVAFSSSASNLVVADTNGAIDVFVHDQSG